MGTLLNDFTQEAKNWWLSLVLGILYILVAIFLIFAPASGYAVISILFSVFLLFSGLLEIAFAISNRRRMSGWGWYFAGGILDVVLGIYLLAYPLVSMEVIPLLIAFWLMFRGFSMISYSSKERRRRKKYWGWYTAFGILAIVCSLFILWQPAIGAFYTVYFVSFAFLFIGILRLTQAIELKRLRDRME